jgi:hypothetical protein
MKGILLTGLFAMSSAASAAGIVATLPNQGNGIKLRKSVVKSMMKSKIK